MAVTARLVRLMLAVVAGAVLAGAATAGTSSQSARFSVTFSATQTTMVVNSWCAPPWLTLNAAVSSVGPIKATLAGTALSFSPNPGLHAQSLRATVAVSMAACSSSMSDRPSRNCGPTTVMIYPGLHLLEDAPGELDMWFGSLKRVFPDSDSCSSGLIGSPDPMITSFNPSSLLRRRVTDVTGTHAWDRSGSATEGTSQVHTEIQYRVRFVRLP